MAVERSLGWETPSTKKKTIPGTELLLETGA
jgi:hypothetical protein